MGIKERKAGRMEKRGKGEQKPAQAVATDRRDGGEGRERRRESKQTREGEKGEVGKEGREGEDKAGIGNGVEREESEGW